jgi:hypothetical protein
MPRGAVALAATFTFVVVEREPWVGFVIVTPAALTFTVALAEEVAPESSVTVTVTV